jgi:uncharacterized protein (DUF952 family)
VPSIFHIATASDWAHAQESGSYTTSTLGRSLEDEGFIHASHAHQWEGVREAFYAGVPEPLVLLEIDTDRLTSPVIEEDTFPHIYGPLNPDAVVTVTPLAG